MDDLRINAQLAIPSAELSWSADRGSSPGGQHANKTSTRVRLEWRIVDSVALDEAQRSRLMVKLAQYITTDGVLQIVASQHRSQHQNLDDAQKRLVALIRAGLKRPKRRKKTRPTLGSKRRRLDAKKRRGKLKKQRGKVDRDD
jgi:ribosome-associated protein